MMGTARLPRTPEAQKAWARHLIVGLNVPPIALFRYERESLGQAYQRIFCRAYELGAEAALHQVLKELKLPDDPLAGLPPHLAKAAQAAARARQIKTAGGNGRRPRGKSA